MKTVLIIIAVLFAFALFGLLAPLIIGVGIGLIFFSCEFTGLGIFSIFMGIFIEVMYLMEMFGGSGSGAFSDDEDTEPGKSGISWPMAFTGLYIIDHHCKDKS